jgi:hypothetical protein
VEKYKKITASVFLLIYICSVTSIHEFLKIPFLASHYIDHNSEESKTNLASFLIRHYIYEDGTDKDADEDNKLPFKSSDNAITLNFISLKPATHICSMHEMQVAGDMHFYIRDDRFIPSNFNALIWQPPRQLV